MEHLFVYGTLRREAGHPLHALLARHARLLGAALLSGRLYDAGGYPAVVPTGEDAERVYGEVYALHAGAAKGVLRELDRYEGCHLDPPEYRRERHVVRFTDGEPVEAWVYVYHPDPGPLPRIASGDYLRPS